MERPLSNRAIKNSNIYIRRTKYSCHIPDLVQAYPYVDNGVLNLAVYLVKPLACKTAFVNSLT